MTWLLPQGKQEAYLHTAAEGTLRVAHHSVLIS